MLFSADSLWSNFPPAVFLKLNSKKFVKKLTIFFQLNLRGQILVELKYYSNSLMFLVVFKNSIKKNCQNFNTKLDWKSVGGKLDQRLLAENIPALHCIQNEPWEKRFILNILWNKSNDCHFWKVGKCSTYTVNLYKQH